MKKKSNSQKHPLDQAMENVERMINNTIQLKLDRLARLAFKRAGKKTKKAKATNVE